MPKGAKKRKAAKKKQEEEEEEASSTQINLKSNNFVSKKEGKETGLDSDERIVITDSSHDHDKSSSSRSSSSSSSSSSSDDESREVKKKEDSVSEVISVSSVPEQPVPIAGDVPFMGATANMIVESTGLMDSTTSSDPNSGELVEIAHVDESSLPKPTPEVSLATDSDVKETEGKTSTLPESSGVTESEVVISHEEEAPVLPTHGVAQRTSWLSCCGLFDVMTGSK